MLINLFFAINATSVKDKLAGIWNDNVHDVYFVSEFAYKRTSQYLSVSYAKPLAGGKIPKKRARTRKADRADADSHVRHWGKNPLINTLCIQSVCSLRQRMGGVSQWGADGPPHKSGEGCFSVSDHARRRAGGWHTIKINCHYSFVPPY